MAGLVDGTINGYLDIRGAILRVGQLDVVGISGVDMATNVLKQDSVLIWDDQGTDLNNPPFTLRGGATRDTTNGYHVLTGNAGGRITRGIKLPNAWMMDFDLYASTQGGSVKIHTYTTSESTYDGTSGYELEFAPSAGTVTLKYRGTQVHQATSVTYATNTFQHYVIGFERGAWTVSIDGTVVFLKDDDERADVYDNTAGQYFRIDASASATHEIRMRKFRLASNGFWLKERNGNLSYETGNVSVGGRNSTHRFDVRGTANVGALTSTTVATSASVEATDTATGTVTTHSIGVVSNAHVQNVYASNCIVDLSLNVFSTANVGALTATSVDASDATAATSVSTGAIVVSGTDGGLGVASNLHATNVFAASHLGIATSDTDYNLDVRGTANVGVLSATLPLATVASNLVTYDTATGQLLDSNGLVSNKLAIVSELPPSALTASGVNNIDKHGNFKVSSSAGTTDYKAFNKSTATASDAWSSATSVYGGTDNAYNGTASINSISGEWLRLDLPHATTLRYVTMTPTNDSTNGVAQFPEDFQLLGSSDDGASWTSLKSVTGQTATSVTDTKTIHVNASARYRSYAVVVTKTGSSASLTSIGELKLFAESFSVDEGVVELRGMESGPMELPAHPLTDYCTYIEGYGSFKVSNPTTGLYNAANSAINLFDHDTSTSSRFISMNHYFSNNNGSYNTAYKEHTTTVGGTRYDGFWAQIEFPRAFTLSHSNIYPTDTLVGRAPHGGAILGSNDGENWYTLTEFTLSWSSTEWKRIDVNATTPYSFYRMAVTDIATSGTFGFMEFTQWRLFAEKPVTKMENVHISGDLSSETLQTGYIKWPRKSLKASESEGYVASQSSIIFDEPNYAGWHAFEEKAEYVDVYAPSWASGKWTFVNTTGLPDTANCATFDGMSCEWLDIKCPQAFELSYFTISERKSIGNNVYGPKDGYMYATNDGVQWTRLCAFSGLTYSGGDLPTRVDVHSSSPYNEYRLLVTKIGTIETCVINELRLFEAATGVGAPPTSAKLQVHGSLGMAKGSSLFAGDSVVAEFPKHDRPLVKYPEVKMTANSSGGYVASASTDAYANNGFYIWKAFNDVHGNEGWHAGEYDNGTNWHTTYQGDSGGAIYNTNSYSRSIAGIDGEWLKLQVPNPIRVKYIRMRARTGATDQAPKDFKIIGSNDDTNWDVLATHTGVTVSDTDDVTHSVQATKGYKYLAIVVTRVGRTTGSDAHLVIGELSYWGTEEGDESVDVVHRSVPNKPGTQQLEVYWDANDSNSYSFADSSNVYDLSGNGKTGTITGTNAFDTEYNAWVFDGSGDSIVSDNLGFSGDQVVTVSLWFRYNAVPVGRQDIFGVGKSGTAVQFGLATYTPGTYLYTGGNDLSNASYNLVTDTNWHHVVAIYRGGTPTTTTMSLYLDNVDVVTNLTSSATQAVNFDSSNCKAYIGENATTSGDLNGQIANFRVFSKALSADQVRELFDYDAARFGIREDLVSVHKGNLGIGLRDPEQKLVVAGSLQEFPPAGGMTGYYTQITGHGVFQAGGSSSWGYASGNANTTGSYAEWRVFDHNRTGDATGSWLSYSATYTSGSPNSSTASINGVKGEYVYLEAPYALRLHSFDISKRDASTMETGRMPTNGIIWGRNAPGDTWERVFSWFGQAYDTSSGSEITTFTVNATKAYKTHALQCTVLHGGSTETALGEWRLRGVPQMDVDDGRQLNVGQVMTSSVGIGTSAPHAPLTVYNDAFGSNHAVTSGTKSYFRYNVNFAYAQSGQHSGGLGIYSLKAISTQSYVVSHSGTLQASDARIKENIADVNDSSALETFRLLQPKLYNYKDVVQRGSLPVWGFIAQDVAGKLNYSTDARTDWVPNIYELANVHADGTVLEFDTTKLETGASKLRLYDRNDSEEDVLIDEIIDEYTVRLSKSIGNADQVFVFGQEVNDFHFLKKDAIWTTAAAALQQVDRELQAEKAKVKALESKLAGERVPLENAEGLAVDANYGPCVTANDPLFLGIVGADGRVAAKGKRAKVWVTNIGAPLSAGDIIATTSNVAGYCSKITDLTGVHHAVGKVLVNVALPQVTDHNFVAPTVPRRRKVTETSNVTVWVREFKSTAEQYATLGEDERRVRDEVYYARDDYVEVVHNEYVDKMPAYDVECYHRTQVDTCDAEIYEALPDSEKVNYVLGEDGVYTYTHVNMITIDAWNALEDDDERDSFVHGYFKNTTTELTEDEWEALEDSAVQARYERRTRPVYFRLIVARELRHGYTEEVRTETVDVLDAFGRPTYEDVEGETDPAFEFRYLTTEGEITDRHSGVHMAALVECMLF